MITDPEGGCVVELDDLGGWRFILGELTAGRDLTAEQANAAMTQVLAGEATRLAYGTDEATEGRDAFLEKRAPDWGPYPWQF